MSASQIPLFDDSNPIPSKPEWGEQVIMHSPLHKDQALSPEELVPEEGFFRLTNTYDYSSSLLSRFLKYFHERNASIKVTYDAIAEELAIPSERFPSLFNFCRKAELLSDGKIVTQLGNIFLKYDQYFLNPGGLWLIHYLISSNPIAVSWSRLFNSITYDIEEFSPTEIIENYRDIQKTMSDKVFRKHGGHELNAILRSYSDYLFKPLGLIVKLEKGTYTVITSEFHIPPLIWLSSILAYRDRFYPGAGSLETNLLVDAHFSPGRLFRQNDEVVRQALDSLHNLGLLTMESRLGLDQVRFKRDVTWITTIARYFEEAA